MDAETAGCLIGGGLVLGITIGTGGVIYFYERAKRWIVKDTKQTENE